MRGTFAICTALFMLIVIGFSYVGAQQTPRVQGLQRSPRVLERGEARIQLPTFRENLTQREKLAVVRQADQLTRQIRADRELRLSPGVRDGLKYWEAMSPEEKRLLLDGVPASADPTLATWAVATVGAAHLLYDMYKSKLVVPGFDSRAIQPHELDYLKTQPQLQRELEAFRLDATLRRMQRQ